MAYFLLSQQTVLTLCLSLNFFAGMGYPVKDSWHHWTYTSTSGVENQVAGYATNYEVQGEVSLLFVWCVVCCICACCVCY